MIDKVFYADHNATTSCDPRVAAFIEKISVECYGNANSDHHYGRSARAALQRSRDQIAECVDCDPEDIVFTSGATEALNLFFKGLAANQSLAFLTSEIEHSAVINSISRRVSRSGSMSFIPLRAGGVVTPGAIESFANCGIDVVTLQAINPETGVQQDIKPLVQAAKSIGALVIVDAAQALWKIPLSFRDWDCDAIVLSAHKAYGPKGAGALIVRRPVRDAITALHDGGALPDQRLRAGTENVPTMAGFGLCCELLRLESDGWRSRVLSARNHFEMLLQDRLQGQVFSWFRQFDRAPNTSSMSFKDVSAELLLIQLTDVAASYGSACNSGSLEPSRVLLASGMERDLAEGTVRFSFGRDFSLLEADQAVNSIVSARKRCL
jgi:cysteine desulfurase